jgi:hypothetical protein
VDGGHGTIHHGDTGTRRPDGGRTKWGGRAALRAVAARSSPKHKLHLIGGNLCLGDLLVALAGRTAGDRPPESRRSKYDREAIGIDKRQPRRRAAG